MTAAEMGWCGHEIPAHHEMPWHNERGHVFCSLKCLAASGYGRREGAPGYRTLRDVERAHRRYSMISAGGTSYMAVEHHGDDR